MREMAQSYWLMQRATRLQNACFTNAEVDCKQLALFLRYRTTYERAFHKALNTLISLKKQRETAPDSSFRKTAVSRSAHPRMRPRSSAS